MASKSTVESDKSRRWRRQSPHCDGWWLFREDGTGEQSILVVGGFVADDEEWSQAMGYEPNETFCENYWGESS